MVVVVKKECPGIPRRRGGGTPRFSADTGTRKLLLIHLILSSDEWCRGG